MLITKQGSRFKKQINKGRKTASTHVPTQVALAILATKDLARAKKTINRNANLKGRRGWKGLEEAGPERRGCR